MLNLGNGNAKSVLINWKITTQLGMGQIAFKYVKTFQIFYHMDPVQPSLTMIRANFAFP